jgi:ABC-2 type transport system ATP-binding protein
MKQRLAIAAALLGDPKVLVFDEPTNGLETPWELAEKIRDKLIIGITINPRGHTIIHGQPPVDEVEKVCIDTQPFYQTG